jgi:putative intracellular protease/amidase
MKVLMVLTSHSELGNTGKKTGFWLEEFAAPYYVFKDAGAEIVLASQPVASRLWIRKVI